MKFLLKPAEALLLGGLGALGVSLAGLAFAAGLDLFWTEGSFRAVVDLPTDLAAALQAPRCQEAP